MNVQQDELQEALAMLHPNVHSLFSRIKEERDLYKARYERLKNLCGFGFRSSDGDWCESPTDIASRI